LLAIVAFFAYATQYTQKINMSVAIVCMVNNTALHEQSEQSKTHLIGQHQEYSNATIDKCGSLQKKHGLVNILININVIYQFIQYLFKKGRSICLV
jgi:hypothetical protein